MDYGTKLLLVLSTGAAILVETLLTARAWPGLPTLVIASFLIAVGLSLAFRSASASIVLFLTYLTPVLVLPLRGFFFVGYGVLWVAALMGAIAPRSLRSGWAVPVRWKGPLVLWGLVISLTWPIVALRELDFTPALLNVAGLPVSGAKLNAAAAITWICDVAATLGVGILWFDWLFLVFGRDEETFRRRILAALGAGWAIAVLVGIYQMFGDIVFLNNGLFASLGRASGTMFDANPFGVVAALGGPAVVAAASFTGNRYLRALAWLAMGLSWLGAWASAARTAFAAAFIASVFVASTAWSGSAWSRRLSRGGRIALSVAAVSGALAVILAAVFLPVASGPLPRLRRTLPAFSLRSFADFVVAMWNRDGYGTVASQLISQFPFFGVGVGSFHILVPDYYFLLTRSVFLRADNAQNWYRHQLAELGLVGSAGWILWIVTFGWFMLSAAPPPRTRVASTIVKGMLLAIALVSLVGMPSQNVAVAITFWTLAFWYVALVGVPEAPAGASRERIGAAGWSAIWIVVALSVGGTAYTARDRLRVPQRAVATGWAYSYGFADVEPTRDLAHRTEAWAGLHAVAVLTPTARWVKLTLAVEKLNLAKGPVDVNVWCDNQPIVVARVADSMPMVRYVRLRDGAAGMTLETRVSRSVRLSDFGLGDGRDRGLLVEWEFVDSAPPGAVQRALSGAAP
jgi:hypothetical protein